MREQVKIIDRYLGRNTLQGFLLVLSVLLVIFVSWSFNPDQ
jgi:lipopolysaccharide export LptBFGC system permease protein LptF